jgi:hypothetical protein
MIILDRDTPATVVLGNAFSDMTFLPPLSGFPARLAFPDRDACVLSHTTLFLLRHEESMMVG